MLHVQRGAHSPGRRVDFPQNGPSVLMLVEPAEQSTCAIQRCAHCRLPSTLNALMTKSEVVPAETQQAPAHSVLLAVRTAKHSPLESASPSLAVNRSV